MDITPAAENTPPMTVEAAAVPSERRGTAPPRTILTALTLTALLGYAAVRIAFTTLGAPADMSAVDDDLVILTGWSGVAVLGIAAIAVVAQAILARREPTPVLRIVVAAAGALSAAALIVASALILLDLVGGILSGLGVAFYPLGALSRLGCVAAAVLTGLHTWRFFLATRTGAIVRPRPTVAPTWVIAAAYAAVLAFGLRVAAQFAVGFDFDAFASAPSAIVFEIGFLLAGTLLPLALAHRWGRIWPRWVPLFAGRRVPRWVVLGPGAVFGTGMVAYFGFMVVQMIGHRLQGRNPFPGDLPEWFFWVSVPAYAIWGVGLLIGAVSYGRLTVPADLPRHRGNRWNR
jgi:hypothetical protein